MCLSDHEQGPFCGAAATQNPGLPLATSACHPLLSDWLREDIINLIFNSSRWMFFVVTIFLSHEPNKNPPASHFEVKFTL